MSWQTKWSPLATHRLHDLPWRDQERIDAAVMRYAETGEGKLVRVATDNAVASRLVVAPYFVRITLDPYEGIMHIWTVYRF